MEDCKVGVFNFWLELIPANIEIWLALVLDAGIPVAGVNGDYPKKPDALPWVKEEPSMQDMFI